MALRWTLSSKEEPQEGWESTRAGLGGQERPGQRRTPLRLLPAPLPAPSQGHHPGSTRCRRARPRHTGTGRTGRWRLRKHGGALPEGEAVLARARGEGVRGHQRDPCQPISSCHPGSEVVTRALDIDTGSNRSHCLLFCFRGREGLNLQLQACAKRNPRKDNARNKRSPPACPAWPSTQPSGACGRNGPQKAARGSKLLPLPAALQGGKNGNGEPDVVAGEEGSATEPRHGRSQVREDIFS